MTRWFKNILSLIILAFLLWYLAMHWQKLKVLLNLGPAQLVTMYFLCFSLTLSSGRVVQCFMKALKTKTPFWDMVRLHHVALLFNYVPMKFGTLFRANYLKRHYGLAYAHFATFLSYITFLMAATAALAGLASLVAIYGLAEYENKILASVFAATIITSLFFLFIPLPVPRGEGWLSTNLRNFLSGRSKILKERNTILASIVLLAFGFFLTAVRLGIIYHSMGQNVHQGGFLILGALGFVVLFIGITPGALGIRELALGCCATVLSIPLEIGILAAIIDRAMIMSYVFVAGGGCAAWLWYKSPAEFKRQQEKCTQQNPNTR